MVLTLLNGLNYGLLLNKKFLFFGLSTLSTLITLIHTQHN
jgi:hypothetical protein